MNINLYGELPLGRVTMAACDSNYFMEHAPAFIHSAGQHNRNVHVHVVNPTDDVLALAAVLTSSVPAKNKVTYTFNDVEFPEAWDSETIRTFYACLRFFVAPMLLNSSSNLLILDIDSIVMDQIMLPFKKQVGYYPRTPIPGTVGWEAEGTKVAAGAIYYTNTPESIEIARQVSEEIRKTPLRWFVDQIALNRVFSGVDEDIIVKFDSDFMDWEFKEGTTIWTGKGPRKYDNPVYVGKKKEITDKVAQKFMSYDHVVLAPRLDIMFKKSLDRAHLEYPQPHVRKWWEYYANKTVRENENSVKLLCPRWMFRNEIQKFTGANTKLYVPHVEKKEWGGDDRCVYYMQTVFPWLFTEDPIGWAGGAEYINSFDPEAEYSEDAFNKLVEYSKKGGSKFKQIHSGRTLQRGKTAGIPFIFVPLQIPNDMTLKYHSKVRVTEFVLKLVDWTKNNPDAPHIIFKGHPLCRGYDIEMMQAIENCEKTNIRDSMTSIQEMFPEAEAVFVINSGTGQEAMLWDVPVATFGDADYTPACFKGNIDDIDFVWEAIKLDDHESRKRQYRRWFDWYVNDICIDLSEEDNGKSS